MSLTFMARISALVARVLMSEVEADLLKALGASGLSRASVGSVVEQQASNESCSVDSRRYDAELLLLTADTVQSWRPRRKRPMAILYYDICTKQKIMVLIDNDQCQCGTPKNGWGKEQGLRRGLKNEQRPDYG